MSSRPLFIVAILALTAINSEGAVFFADDFNDGSIGTNFELAPGSSGIAEAGGVITDSGRNYLRTVANDYNTVDFIAEISIDNTNGGGGNQLAFFGLGPGTKDGGFFNESNGVYTRIGHAGFSAHVVSDRGIDADGNTETVLTATVPSGLHRVRMTKTGNNLLFEIDDNYNGTFAADYSSLQDLSTFENLNSSNSHIYFGGGGNSTTFDNFVIVDPNAAPVPEPASIAVWGLLGLVLGGRRLMQKRHA